MLTRQQKAEQLAELKDNFQKASSVIFTHYIGMTVADVSALRRKLRDGGAEMKVAKKTLMRLAAKDLNLPELKDDVLTGPIACIFSYQDPLAGAQVAYGFAKDHQQVAFVGGLFEGKILSAADAKNLATIPSRQVLLATFAGMLQSPLRSFMSICNNPLTSFARATAEMAKKAPSPAAAPADAPAPAAA